MGRQCTVGDKCSLLPYADSGIENRAIESGLSLSPAGKIDRPRVGVHGHQGMSVASTRPYATQFSTPAQTKHRS